MKTLLLALSLPVCIAIGQDSVETYMENQIQKAPLLDAPGPGYPRTPIFIKSSTYVQEIPVDWGFHSKSPMSLTNTNEERKQTLKSDVFSAPVELRLFK